MARLYEVVVSGFISGQQAIWRSNWLSAGASEDTITALVVLRMLGYEIGAPQSPAVGSVFAYFQAIATGNAYVDVILARDVHDVDDIMEIPLVDYWIGGEVGGSYMPSFVSPKMRSGRVRQDIKRGFISTWGVQEADVDDNDVLGSAIQAKQDNLATALSGGIAQTIDGTAYVIQNCIVAKERYMVPGSGTDAETNPARYAYRYYANKATQLSKLAVDPGWAGVRTVSSQVSRKRGKGK